jgi:hypothetical protein
MAAPTPDMTAPSGGRVMVQMPSDAFDSIYTLVTQLAAGLESLRAEVEAQKQGAATTSASPEAESMPADEDFLKSIAQEGSMR